MSGPKTPRSAWRNRALREAVGYIRRSEENQRPSDRNTTDDALRAIAWALIANAESKTDAIGFDVRGAVPERRTKG